MLLPRNVYPEFGGAIPNQNNGTVVIKGGDVTLDRRKPRQAARSAMSAAPFCLQRRLGHTDLNPSARSLIPTPGIAAVA